MNGYDSTLALQSSMDGEKINVMILWEDIIDVHEYNISVSARPENECVSGKTRWNKCDSHWKHILVRVVYSYWQSCLVWN